MLNEIRSAELNCQSESIADACKVDEHGAWNDQDVDVSHLGVSFIHRVQSVARSCPRVKSELNPQFTPSTNPGEKNQSSLKASGLRTTLTKETGDLPSKSRFSAPASSVTVLDRPMH